MTEASCCKWYERVKTNLVLFRPPNGLLSPGQTRIGYPRYGFLNAKNPARVAG